jgi:chaperonin GroES
MANAYNAIEDADSAEEQGAEASPQLVLTALMAMPNIVESLVPEKLSEISHKVIEEYDIDEESRKEWMVRNEAALKLAMLSSTAKTYPWKDAANIKYPLLTVAALQFNARAYPAIVQGNRVVKCGTWGRDPRGTKAARGERVSEYMSYQLLVESPEWEEDTDRKLIILPIVGCSFRKVWYDPSLKRNTSRLVTADNLVINYLPKCAFSELPRMTERMHLYPHEIQERIRAGLFIEFDYANAPADTTNDKTAADQDQGAPHLFLEQHRLLDLDEDGYPEPYVVTVHHSTQKVCRIAANYDADTVSYAPDGRVSAIRKQQYYVRYLFMPSPDGGAYGMGFGWLTKDLGEAINTLVNQMLDAGHLSVVQAGLVSSSVLKKKEQKIVLTPGELRVVDTGGGKISDGVMMINYPGPSAVLFTLLGLMIDAGKDITGVKDVLTGEGMGKNASPTTTMALIEQGLQQFTAIYKRIHRALKAELGIMARLNKKHVDPQKYAEFFDEPEQPQAPAPDPQSMAAQQGQGQPGMQPIMGQQGPAPQGPPDPAKDFDESDNDILPVTDPATVSKMQKLAKAEFIYQTAKENPRVEQGEALKRMFEAADVDKSDELILPPPQQDPETIALMKRGAEAEVAVIEADIALKREQANLAKEQAEKLDTDAAASIEEKTAGLHMADRKDQVDEAVKVATIQTNQAKVLNDANRNAIQARSVELDAEKAARDHEIKLKQLANPSPAGAA